MTNHMSDCIFCKIIAGEMDSEKILETDNLIVIKDAFPQAPKHFLVIPKTHVATLNDVDDSSLLAEMMMTAKEVAKKEGIADDGYRIVVNTNKGGGQVVFHLHLHLMGGRELGGKMG